MISKTCLRGVAAAIVLACASPALAAAPKTVFPEAARAVDGGRAVQVLVAQEELKSNINQSNVVAATGGGLLGAMIDIELNKQRAQKAEIAIAPLRTALAGFDADILATETTKKILDQAPWLQGQGQAFSRDSSPAGKLSALDAAATPQTLYFEYIYDTAPDFSAVRVSVNIQVASRTVPEGKKPEARIQPRNLVFAQTLTSVVLLDTPSKELSENAPRWAAENAAQARKALAVAFGQLAVIAPRALALTEADIKVMNGRDRKVQFSGGYSGRVQEDGADGALLFNGAFVHVQTLKP